MKVAIVGSRPPALTAPAREWERFSALLERVREYVRSLPAGTIVVSGGASGVDQCAEAEAKACGLNVEIHYPQWRGPNGFNRGAGFARNRAIVHAADAVTAFWDEVSRGTRHTIDVTLEMGKPLIVYLYDGNVHELTNSTMRLFPDQWANPRAHLPVVRTPVGAMCGSCDRAVGEHDRGLWLPLLGERGAPPFVAFHRECYLSSLGVDPNLT